MGFHAVYLVFCSALSMFTKIDFLEYYRSVESNVVAESTCVTLARFVIIKLDPAISSSLR